METELDDVEGDLRLNIANKFYTFFLYEPSRPVYICQ